MRRTMQTLNAVIFMIQVYNPKILLQSKVQCFDKVSVTLQSTQAPSSICGPCISIENTTGQDPKLVGSYTWVLREGTMILWLLFSDWNQIRKNTTAPPAVPMGRRMMRTLAMSGASNLEHTGSLTSAIQQLQGKHLCQWARERRPSTWAPATCPPRVPTAAHWDTWWPPSMGGGSGMWITCSTITRCFKSRIVTAADKLRNWNKI